jgi:hypothetical protein
MSFQLPESAQVYQNAFLMEVTPEMAYGWLGKNFLNRKLDQSTVQRYYRQIVYGKWRATHQGIAFDRNGILLDGQHRLAAICKANKPVEMLVFTNQSFNNHEVIDGEKSRTNLDVIQLELQDCRVSTKHLMTLRAMFAGPKCVRPNWTSKELNDKYKQHAEAVQFAVDQMASAYSMRIDDATVRGVIARAFYRVSESKLLAFCGYLRSAVGPQPQIISDLRDWLVTLHDQRETTRREIYCRTEYTLLAFVLDRETISIPFCTKELFPLK